MKFGLKCSCYAPIAAHLPRDIVGVIQSYVHREYDDIQSWFTSPGCQSLMPKEVRVGTAIIAVGDNRLMFKLCSKQTQENESKTRHYHLQKTVRIDLKNVGCVAFTLFSAENYDYLSGLLWANKRPHRRAQLKEHFRAVVARMAAHVRKTFEQDAHMLSARFLITNFTNSYNFLRYADGSGGLNYS